MKKDNTLPLIIGAGAVALLLSSTAKTRNTKITLSGDDAKDMLTLLKQMGAPPDLLAYLATKPTLLKEAATKGTINGVPLKAEPTKPRSGGGGGGGGGGSGAPKGGGTGSMSGAGSTDVVSAVLALGKLALDGIKKLGGWLFAPSTPAALKSSPERLTTKDYEAQLMGQVQSGNLTQSQADELRALAIATGDTSARSIGDMVDVQASALFAEGSIDALQYQAILDGSQTASGAMYENAWRALDAESVAQGGTAFHTETPPSENGPGGGEGEFPDWNPGIVYDPETGEAGTPWNSGIIYNPVDPSDPGVTDGGWEPGINYDPDPYVPGINWDEEGTSVGWPDDAPDGYIDIGIDYTPDDTGYGDYSNWEEDWTMDWADEYADFITGGSTNDDYSGSGSDNDWNNESGTSWSSDWGSYDGLWGVAGLSDQQTKTLVPPEGKRVGVLPLVAGMTALEILAAGAAVYTFLKKDKS